jgi:hypothetical protein
MNDEEPLIYTSVGNMKLSDLEYKYYWLEDAVAITFVEEYRTKASGELVKKNAHARLKQGLDSAIEQQLFGTR